MTKEVVLPACLVVLSILVNTSVAQVVNGECPNLQSVVPSTIPEIFSAGYLYVVLVPVTPLNLVLDNICYSITSLPDNSENFLLAISRVFSDRSNQVNSYIISEPQLGVIQYSSPTCSFLDIPFANVTLNGPGECDILLAYRCVLDGDCGGDFEVNPPIFGISYTPRPISAACIESARSTIISLGFPDQNYITYPMRLPRQCVYRQFSSRPSALQHFLSLIGF